MRRKWILISIAIATSVALIAGLSQAQGPEPQGEISIQATLGTTFTYQGQLKSGGQPVSGECDMAFYLYDDATGGSQVGSAITITVPISKGLFTVDLNFGSGAFNGEARWLEIAVRCPAGSGSYTTLSPRQALTPVPYALALPGLWTQQNATSPNLIGGYSGNSVTDGVVGAAIGGGGKSGATNRVTDNYSTVGGGYGNRAGDDAGATADAAYATVGGGWYNVAAGFRSTVAGGAGNQANGWDAFVGGGSGNEATGEAAAVGGGRGNEATATYATVGGGYNNTAGEDRATVGGGYSNTADGYAAVVAGGEHNTADGPAAIVGGGYYNTASGDYATVGGGFGNVVTATYATVGGGYYNIANADYATIAGGGPSDPDNPTTTNNRVFDNYGTIGGGGNNRAGSDDGDPTSATYATVGGGEENTASADYATVGGGVYNTASGSDATVGGGVVNTASGHAATVGGGAGNTVSGSYATVPGGLENTAQGDYSFAAGRWAEANHQGAFVWADSQVAEFASTGDNQFLVRASGGMGVGTNSPATQLHVVKNVSGGASPENHVAFIENTSTGTSPDVLALKVNIEDPGGASNFITFIDASGNIGAVEGNGTGGVTYKSGSGDFAEYLPWLGRGRLPEGGEIVGLFAAGVSRETHGAWRALVVSTAPIVLGNQPPAGEESRYVPVAFLGQVPVRVRGPVHAGDYIIPSGHSDGIGVAVAPEDLKAGQINLVVGQALEDAAGDEVHQVKVLVGLPQTAILQTVLAERDSRITALEARVAALEQGRGHPTQAGLLPGVGLLLVGLGLVWVMRQYT